MGWARLTDKIGRRTVYLYTCAFAVPFGVLMFLLVNTGIFLLIIATFVLAYGVVQNSMAGAQGAWFPELFTANTRASGASLAYQISAMVSGFTPFITTLLFVSFGWIGPALLFSTYAAIGLVAALVTRETWGPRERQLADEAAAAEPTRPTCSSPRVRGISMTLTVETGRRQKVAAAAYRMRHHVLNMGEAQGQGYVGQALGAADMLAAVYADQLRYRAEDPHWAGP